MLAVCVFFYLFNGVSKEYIFVPLVHEHIVDFCIIFFEDLACSSSFWKKMEPLFLLLDMLIDASPYFM